MIRRIHVNQHVIRANRKSGAREPVITVKSSRGNVYGHTVEILGPSRVVYRPDAPLPCGAQVWVETEAEVAVDGRPPTPAEKAAGAAKRKGGE
jgi:hypothetical protein